MENLGRAFIFFLTYLFLADLLYCAKIDIQRVGVKERDIVFELYSNKKEAYVGESILVTLRLKIKRDVEVVDYRFTPPVFYDFWVERVDQDRTNNLLLVTKKYFIKELKYVVFPQKSGLLRISPATLQIATPSMSEDSVGGIVEFSKWRSLKTNELLISVKELPENVDLIGVFSLSVDIDKTKTKPNEPVNVSVKIQGRGNVENLENIDLPVENAIVYSDVPKKIKKFYEDDLNVTFIQKFSIVSDENFTVGPLKLKFFDPSRGKISLLSSEPISVEVLGTEPLKSDRPALFENKNRWIYFMAGFLFAAVLAAVALLVALYFSKKGKKVPKIESDKRLLMETLARSNGSDELYLFAKELYENIYKNGKNRIDRKRLKKLLEERSREYREG